MRARFVIFNSEGESLIGVDGAHGDEHAMRVIAENMVMLRAAGVDAIAVEFDVFEGGNAYLDDLKSLSSVRAEIRVLPDGRREVIDVLRHQMHPGRKRGGGHTIARAVRVIDGPADIANPRAQLHRRPRGDAA